ncbi:MAG: 5-formyltetrahydrofolate cyclo-ligase [Cyclobacteriaceae bacterium]
MTKAELRREFRAKRKALSYQEYNQRNEQIFELFRQHFPVTQPTTAHSYLASEEKREAGTTLIIMHLLASPQVTVATPRSHPGGNLTHHLFTLYTSLDTNRCNIREPLASEPLVPTEELDWVIVPLLAFDRMGYRVGYGQGFYDRFLAQCRPDVLKIGLSLEPPVGRIPDINNHDVPLNYVIIPQQVFTFSE